MAMFTGYTKLCASLTRGLADMFKLSHKFLAAIVVGIAVAGGLWTMLDKDRKEFSQIATITPDVSQEQQAWSLIRSGALIVDVRTPEEYAVGHLEGAIHVPHDQVAAQLKAFGDDKARTIVLYCGSGRRAGLAETTLADAGYGNVFNAGGYQPMISAKTEESGS